MPTPLSLPEPRNETLKNSPLSLVVCQVRHQGGAMIDATGAEKIHQFISANFPHVEPDVEGTVNITAGSEGIVAQQTPPLPLWRFRSEDGWVAVLGQTYFAVETTKYDRWNKFVDYFGTLMRSVADICEPPTEERVGLRFINRIDMKSDNAPEQFQGYITDETLGLLVGGKLSPSINSVQSIVDLQGPDDISIRLQHGYQSEDKVPGYIIDTDCYRQSDIKFDADSILRKVELFHRLCKQIFEAVITEQLYDNLRR